PILAHRRGFISARGKRSDRIHPSRREGHLKRILETLPDRLVDGGIVIRIGAVKSGLPCRRLNGQTIERAESIIVKIIIFLNNQIAAAQLGHEMERLRIVKRAQNRTPIAAIRINRPDAPESLITQTLAFKTAEQNASVLK